MKSLQRFSMLAVFGIMLGFMGCTTHIESDIIGDVTWKRGQTYEIGWLPRISGNLTIEPGVTIRFANADSGLIVSAGGTITAVGTENSHIVFTSASVQAPGAWQGVFFESGSNPITLTYCDFLYGGNDDYYDCAVGGFITTGSTITHCTFAHSLTVGLDADPTPEIPGDVTITNNTFYSNVKAPVRIGGHCIFDATNIFHQPGASTDWANNCIKWGGSSISGIKTFDITEVPYYIGSLGIGGCLTINPGVALKFTQDDYSLALGSGATLTAVGTFSQPVVFTSYRDDLRMGDSNGDGPSSGSPGDWARMFTQASSSVTLAYCTFMYGGYNNTYVIDGLGSLDINHCTISQNLYGGVDASGAGLNTTIANSVFSGNATIVSGPYDINRNGNSNVTLSANVADLINP